MARWAERSDLLPAKAMMMASGAWRWSSLTHAFALSREDFVRLSIEGVQVG